MVLALILSSLAWLVAVETEDPTVTERYPQAIPIALSGLPEGIVLLGEFTESVEVDVRTIESIWQELSVEDFVATADLTGLGPGVHEVPVQVELDKTPSRILQITPELATVELERYVERSVPVRIQIEGEPALGYLRRTATVIPREVIVSGPQSYVDRAVEARTVISVQDANADIAREFPLEVQDDEGQPVPFVELVPQAVNVRIPIELSGYYRPLAVRVVLEGQIAPDYRIVDISVDPSTVTLFGPPDVIASIPGYIETEPIDVEGASADIIERPRLNLPPNVSVVIGQQPVEVNVAIEAIQSGRTVEITPTLQGLRVGLTATVPLETVEVILSGSLPVLDGLETDDVRVVLDLFGLAIGTHQIEPQVVVPEDISVQNVLPAVIQVEVRASTFPIETPTPTATSALTPTTTTNE
jgi:YbbR domain-containing protein